MSGIMLTSTGLENPIIEKEFLKMIGKTAFASLLVAAVGIYKAEAAIAFLPIIFKNSFSIIGFSSPVDVSIIPLIVFLLSVHIPLHNNHT